MLYFCLFYFFLQDQAKKDIFQAERLINRETGWELMMEHFHFHAKWMVRYAKKAPGKSIEEQCVP